MSTLELNSLEVLYRHEQPDSNVNAWLFSNGIDRYCVLGGHTLTVLGDYSAESLWSTSSRFSRVTVTNGTFKADAVKIGAINNHIFREPNIVAQDAAFRCGSGSLTMEGPGTTVAIRKGVDLIGPFTRLRVAGPATCIAVSGTATNSISLRMGTRLSFTLPENGYAATPLTTAGGVTVMADEDVMDVDPVKLVIDPSAFDAERKGRKQTLLSCATASVESLQRLVDNVEFVNAARHGTVTVEDGGTLLVYNGLSGSTAVFVR